MVGKYVFFAGFNLMSNRRAVFLHYSQGQLTDTGARKDLEISLDSEEAFGGSASKALHAVIKQSSWRTITWHAVYQDHYPEVIQSCSRDRKQYFPRLRFFEQIFPGVRAD